MPILSHLAILALALQTAAAPAAAPVPVRIGVLASDDNAQPFYAEARGTFERLGLAPEIREHLAGAAAVKAVLDGRIDVGWSNCISVVKAIQEGEPVVILGPATILDAAHPGSELMQAPGSHYRSGKDLEGKVVASPSGPGSLGALGPAVWIDETGGNSRSVRMVGGIPQAKIAEALDSGRVDAAEMTEPEKTIHLMKGDVKRLAPSFDAIAPRFIGGVWVASKDWVAAHPQAARHYAEAMRETALWANRHHAETAALLVKLFKIPPEVIRRMSRTTYAVRFTPALLQPPLDAAARYGVITPVKAEEIMRGVP